MMLKLSVLLYVRIVLSNKCPKLEIIESKHVEEVKTHMLEKYYEVLFLTADWFYKLIIPAKTEDRPAGVPVVDDPENGSQVPGYPH
ncbi:MAG: hypothetical protein HQM14_06975 [SAR324 cluster bacterium]|nr:hypothetical protein [SAR324 cluster bacterium]